MKKLILSFFAVSCLTGCADSHETKSEFIAAKQECDSKYPLKVGNYYRHSVCIDTAEFSYTSGSPIDFHEAKERAAARDNLAQKVDAGEISVDDAHLLLEKASAQAHADAVGESRERQRDAMRSYMNSRFMQQNQNKPVNCTSYKMGMFVNTSCN